MITAANIQALNNAGWKITDFFTTEEGKKDQEFHTNLEDACRFYSRKVVGHAVIAGVAACVAAVFPPSLFVAGFFTFLSGSNYYKRHFVLDCADRITRCSQGVFYLEKINEKVGKRLRKIEAFTDSTTDAAKKKQVKKIQKQVEALNPFIESLDAMCKPFPVKQEIQELHASRTLILALAKQESLDDQVKQIASVLKTTHDTQIPPLVLNLRAFQVIEKRNLLDALKM